MTRRAALIVTLAAIYIPVFGLGWAAWRWMHG
jgi:hypothetical protein